MTKSMAAKLKYFQPIANLRSKLQLRRQSKEISAPLTGVGITLADGMITDALADTCDWFWFDLEHNSQSPESIRNHIFIAHGRGIPAIVRVSGPNCLATQFDRNVRHSIWSSNIKQAIDMGSDGIVVPQIETVDDVISVINDCKYPIKRNIFNKNVNNSEISDKCNVSNDFDNRRGFGVTIGTNYGRSSVQDYVNESNKQIFKCIMIETYQSIKNIKDICQIDELDGLFIGSNDLSAALGVPYDVHSNETQDAIDTVINTAKQHKKYVLFSTADVHLAAKMTKKGIDMLHSGDDTVSAVKHQTLFKHKLQETMLQK